jgi:hypothetical protein
MMGPTLEAALTTEVSNTILGLIAPVAALPTTDLAAAFGAFAVGVSGLVLSSVLRHPRRSATRGPATITALRPARLLRVLRHAAWDTGDVAEETGVVPHRPAARCRGRQGGGVNDTYV